MLDDLSSEPYEKARSLVAWYCKTHIDTNKGISHSTIKLAKMSAHKLCDEVMRELWSNHQKTYEGIERHEYWKKVKSYINSI